VSVTLRNFSVRVPTKPSRHVPSPVWMAVSTRIASLNNLPEMI